MIFTDEFKKDRLDKLSGVKQPDNTQAFDFFDLEHDSLYLDFLGIDKDKLKSENDDVKIPVFRGRTFRDCVSINESRSIGGSVGSKEGKKKGGQKGGQKNAGKVIDNILQLIIDNPSITRKALSEIVGISPSAIQKYINRLKAEGIIVRNGGDRGGHWEIINTEEK